MSSVTDQSQLGLLEFLETKVDLMEGDGQPRAWRGGLEDQVLRKTRSLPHTQQRCEEAPSQSSSGDPGSLIIPLLYLGKGQVPRDAR